MAGLLVAEPDVVPLLVGRQLAPCVFRLEGLKFVVVDRGRLVYWERRLGLVLRLDVLVARALQRLGGLALVELGPAIALAVIRAAVVQAGL
jgi:hypothetical protein